MMEISNDECNNPRQASSLTMKAGMEMVVVLPEDLMLEILLRVPPISILTFKCVCKSWYSLISNPCFLRNHAASQFHLQNLLVVPPGLLLSPDSDVFDPEMYSVYAILPQDQDHDQDEDVKLMKVFLDHSLPAFQQMFSDYFLIDSCNGLLLYLYHTESGSPPHRCTVFNPITNQFREVPLMNLLQTFFIKPNELENTMLYEDHPHIVFDPSKSSSYKVLTILSDTHSTHFELYAYSSDTGSWRLLNYVIAEYYIGRKTFMFDGVFYWLCSCHSICFDVVKESVWLLPLPPVPAGHDRDVLYFGECGGRLRLIEEYCAYGGNAARTFPCSFDIMEMEQDSTIWTVKSRVILVAGYDHLIQDTSDPLYHAVVKVVHLYETEKGEEAVVLNVGYKKIVSFNITTNTFGKELTLPYFERLDCLDAFPFMPTLFPLLM